MNFKLETTVMSSLQNKISVFFLIQPLRKIDILLLILTKQKEFFCLVLIHSNECIVVFLVLS